MVPVGILMIMATLTPTRALVPCFAALGCVLSAVTPSEAQDVVLSPAFSTPIVGQPLPYNVANGGTDTVSVCLTNGWSAIGIQGSSPFAVERRFGNRWHKVLGKDLRNQLAQPIAAGHSTRLAMAGLGESGTYRMELNYVHGLVPSCWAPHEGKIHVLHSAPFDLQDSAPKPRMPDDTTPELIPRHP